MKKLLFTTLMVLACSLLRAQNYTSPFYWNLLDEKTYDFIVGESSGDLSYYHVLEMAPYEKNRTKEQYETNLHETQYIVERLKEYGLEGVKIERLGRTKTWDAISASLWEVSPKTAKIADYKDLSAHLAQGSQNTNTEAELVWVGSGTKDEIDRVNVDGKIVVTEGSASRTLAEAIKKGAIGVVSFNAPRPLIDPIQIPNSGISGSKGFGFNITPRDGVELKKRLLNGEKIVVKAKVETTIQELDIQVPTCYIKGTDENAQEIIFFAHLFEGYVKLGANDNTSGVAALLDIARTLNTLIADGKIERPKRTIRFVWGAEFSASIPWVKANKDIVDRAIFNLNMDMVGLWLSKSASYYCLNRTTMGNPHYINDLTESLFHYIGATNKAFTATGVGRPEATKPIYSVTGSRDPFYYSIGANYGASDHEVFNDFGVQVPGIITITWTDNYYHTSGDRPSILDPTQLKRAVVIGAAVAYTAAIADEKAAIKIAGEVLGNATKRIGLMCSRSNSNINDCTNDNLYNTYKKAHFDIQAQTINEIATIKSVKELAKNSITLQKYIDNQVSVIKDIEKASLKSIDNMAVAKASSFGISINGIKLSVEELTFSKIYPKATKKVKQIGHGVLRGVNMQNIKLPNSHEAARLTKDGTNSILDIKKILDVQFPTNHSLSEIAKYMDSLKAAGLVTF